MRQHPGKGGKHCTEAAKLARQAEPNSNSSHMSQSLIGLDSIVTVS